MTSARRDLFLEAGQVVKKHDPESFTQEFETTEELTLPNGLINQPRAIEGLQLGLSSDDKRFNIRVVQPGATSRATAVIKEVKAFVRERYGDDDQDIFDLCEVDTSRPMAPGRNPKPMFMPRGEGATLKEGMTRFFEDLRRVSLEAFVGVEFSEEHKKIQKGREGIEESQNEKMKDRLEDKYGIRLTRIMVNDTTFHVLPRVESDHVKISQISADDVVIVSFDPSGGLLDANLKPTDFDEVKKSSKTYIIQVIVGNTPEYWLLNREGGKIFQLVAIPLPPQGIIWGIPPDNLGDWVGYIESLEEERQANGEDNKYFCVQVIPPADPQKNPPNYWVLDNEGNQLFEMLTAHDMQTMTRVDYWTIAPSYVRESLKYIGISDDKLGEILDDIRDFEKELREELSKMQHEFGEQYESLCCDTMGKVFDQLVEGYREKYPDAGWYFDSLRKYTIGIHPVFQAQSLGQPLTIQVGQNQFVDCSLPFMVNVLVDNSELEYPVPIIYESDPSFENLFGEVARPMSGMGPNGMQIMQAADHMSLKAGSLLKANGGILIIPAERLFKNRYVGEIWSNLIGAIKDEETKAEDIATHVKAYSDGMEQEKIALNVRVVLIVDQELDHFLSERVPGDYTFFKAKAELLSSTDRTFESELMIAQMLGSLTRRSENKDALHCSKEACSVFVEHASRIAGDQEKTSLRFDDLKSLLNEADFWAKERIREEENQSNSASISRMITQEDVRQALEHQIYRSDAMPQRIQEMINEGTLKVKVSGEQVGRINALAVYGGGDIAFGMPSVVSASTSPGGFDVVNIEREIKMAGPSQQKSVFIIGGYLKRKFGTKLGPLALNAQITFEQSYGGVDGDSASLAEFIVVISDLTGLPIRQDIAITGSCNQHGESQAIGGANYKIEGFYDTCKMANGGASLTGNQTVIIPRDNIGELMLREDVVEAVSDGNFHIAVVSTVDEAMEIAMGMDADEINKLVEEKLKEFKNLSIEKDTKRPNKSLIRRMFG